jgi:hypothetical protein
MLCLVLGACASSPASNPHSDLNIGGLSIFNRGSAYVSAAQLLVPATGNFVSCGNIAPGAVCSTAFPERTYTGNPVEVTWSQGGRIHTTGPMEVLPSEEVLEAGTAEVRIVIVSPGLAAVELLPIKSLQTP